VKDVADPFIKQLWYPAILWSAARTVGSPRFLAKGAGMPVDWLNEIKGHWAWDVDFWNPFDGIRCRRARSPRTGVHASRFSAAIGAGWGFGGNQAMNLQVNLILDTERRSGSNISRKFIIRIVAACADPFRDDLLGFIFSCRLAPRTWPI